MWKSRERQGSTTARTPTERRPYLLILFIFAGVVEGGTEHVEIVG
jgi:hypothetical protein